MDTTPPARPHRIRRFLRLGGGWLLIAIAVIAFLADPTTSENPERNCGAPSIVVVFDQNAASVPDALKAECHEDAAGAMLAGIFLFATPGLILLLWPRGRHALQRRRDDALRRAADVDTSRPIGRSYIGPAPIALSFASPLPASSAADQLRTLGNGGPQGSLRVRLVDNAHVDARLVTENTPRFVGALTPTTDGSELRGIVRPGTDERFRVVFMASFTLVFVVVGLGILIASAPSGRLNYAFVPVLGFAAFMGAFAEIIRRFNVRSFPVTVNRLSTLLASALETEAPIVPTDPISTRAARAFGFGVIGLQIGVLAVRTFMDAGLFVAIVVTGGFTALFVFLFRASSRFEPRLDGNLLRIGFRAVDLSQVDDVRARKAFMSLSDGRNRVVVSSAFGRLEAVEAAETMLRDQTAQTPEKERNAARTALAIGQVVDRCLLDEGTAAVLHRPVTLPGVTRPGPRFDVSAVAPAVILLGGMAVLFLVLGAMR